MKNEITPKLELITNPPRQTALVWWSELDSSDKLVLWRKYQEDTFTPSGSPSDLTGREIETIWGRELILGLSRKYLISQKKYRDGMFSQKDVDEMLDRQAAITASQILTSKAK